MQQSQFSDPPHISNWHPSYVYESPDLGSLLGSEVMVQMNREEVSGASKVRMSSQTKQVNNGVKKDKKGVGNVSRNQRPSQMAEGRDEVRQAIGSQRPSSQVGYVSRSKRPSQSAESRDEVGSRKPREEAGDEASRSHRNSQNQQPPSDTVIGLTSESPDEIDGPFTKKQKKVHGPTVQRELTLLPANCQLPVEFGGLRGGPIGQYTGKFASACGITARTTEYVPIQLSIPYKDYVKKEKTKDETYGQFLLKVVRARFKLKIDDEKAERKVLRKIGKSYSEHLCTTKEKYFKNMTAQEIKDNPPPYMGKDDWEFLVAKWNSEEHKVISERNSKNRAKAVLINPTGSCSHDKIFDEETKKNGIAPGVFELFQKCYTDKLGVPKNPEAARIISTVSEEAARAEQEGQPFNKDEAYLRLRPKDKGKMKYAGRLSNPTDVARIDELNRQLKQTKEAMKKQNREMKAMKKQVSRFMAAFQGAGINVPSEAQDESDEETQDDSDEETRGGSYEAQDESDEVAEWSDDSTQGGL